MSEPGGWMPKRYLSGIPERAIVHRWGGADITVCGKSLNTMTTIHGRWVERLQLHRCERCQPHD